MFYILFEPFRWNMIREWWRIGGLKSQYISLGLGELEVIWWVRCFKSKNVECICALDDLKARKIAKKLRLKVTGTLGIKNIE